MLALDKEKRKNKNFVLILCIIYLFFACFYVFLCQKNNNIVSLFDTIVSTHQKLALKPTTKNHSSIKFLSRPRVIVNRITNPSFAFFISFCILFLVNNTISRKNDFFNISNHYQPALSIYCLRVWRI
jgi:hypothetical protein